MFLEHSLHLSWDPQSSPEKEKGWPSLMINVVNKMYSSRFTQDRSVVAHCHLSTWREIEVLRVQTTMPPPPETLLCVLEQDTLSSVKYWFYP